MGVSTPASFQPGVGRSAIYKANLAQDGHSLGEQAVYEVLWREGKTDKLRTDNDDPWAARYVSLGYADVAARARINKKSAKLNLQRLIEKQAIEVTSEYIKETSSPRTYRVLSYREIVDRRRRAGMIWVVRNKAVTFVSAEGIPLEIHPLGVSTTGLDTPSGPTLGSAPSPVVVAPIPGVAQAATPPGVESPTHINREVFLENSLEIQTTTTTLTNETAEIAKVFNLYATADDFAAEQLLRDCRSIRPDATMDEILDFLQEKGFALRRNRTIQNPTGFLLVAVPRCFVGTSFAVYRQQKLKAAELQRAEEQRRLETEREMRAWFEKKAREEEAILSDPNTSPDRRKGAERFLKEFASYSQASASAT